MPTIRPPSPELNRIRPISGSKGFREAVPGLSEAKSFSEAFVACLRSLIAELRSKPNRFITRLKLVNGERQEDIQQNVYTFVLDDNDKINEGSRVQVHFKATKYSGQIIQITNITPRIMYIQIDGDLGKTIDFCEIEQDDAALYDALLERYSIEMDQKDDRAIKKVGCNFSTADRVLRNEADNIEHRISVSSSELNSDQYNFIQKALSHDISYLWGPPGTGKTKCLGGMITALYDASERSVITSNTNQAVDQVLLKLCRDLKASDRIEELEKGQIIREGPIHNSELRNEFGKYLDINSITELIGRKLSNKRDELTQKASNYITELESFPSVKQKIEEAEFWNREITNFKEKEETNQNQLSSLLRKQTNLASEKDKLSEELASVGSRGLIKALFGKSRSKLESEIRIILPKLDTCSTEIKETEEKIRGLKSKIEIDQSHLDENLKITKGLSIDQLIAQNKLSKENLKELNFKIKNINKQLENLSEKIMREARVVGATLTRIFLIPRKIGKFENLIIDEASTPSLPLVHFASSMAEKRVVISGDFRQLPPIIDTNNKIIENIIFQNVFMYSKHKPPIADLFKGDQDHKNAHMLKWQYRMPDEVCDLLSEFSYNSQLKTAPNSKKSNQAVPDGFEGSITVLDTSEIMPFCDVNSSGSRYNIMHALMAERVAQKFVAKGGTGTIGYCSPFKAQSDLVGSIFYKSGLKQDVTAATIHVYQGDEKDIIIFDTVDGLGGAKTAGSQISKDNPEEAQLLNVAMSRASQGIIIIANLKLLDTTLPAMAFLRKILSRSESMGSVINAKSFMPFEKIETSVKSSLIEKHEKTVKLLSSIRERETEINRTNKELQKLKDQTQRDITLKIADINTKQLELDRRNKNIVATETGIQNKQKNIERIESDLEKRLKELDGENISLKRQLSKIARTLCDGRNFAEIFEHDARAAKHSIVIYSGFTSARRVLKLLDLFEEIITKGVKIRVVARWQKDDYFFTKDGVPALELLRRIGVTVDLRAEIHQKNVLIDKDITYNGSLNALSYVEGKSDELMERIQGQLVTLEYGRALALRGERSIRSFSDLVKAENPKCKKCKSLTEFTRSRYRAEKFICIKCGMQTPLVTGHRR